MRYINLLIVSILLASCAGYRGGWESVAYIGEMPPSISDDSVAQDRVRHPSELNVPGLKLQVTIDNRLRTHDTQVYLFALPLSVDPRDVYTKNVAPGKTRVFITVTPQVSNFVFRPSSAVLQVNDKRLIGATGFEFGMWNAEWKRVDQGGKWEHRPVTSEYILSDIGRRYYLSIDFETPVPSPESTTITLDLSQALKSSSEPLLPLIRFVPVRWKESYS